MTGLAEGSFSGHPPNLSALTADSLVTGLGRGNRYRKRYSGIGTCDFGGR